MRKVSPGAAPGGGPAVVCAGSIQRSAAAQQPPFSLVCLNSVRDGRFLTNATVSGPSHTISFIPNE